MARKTDRKHEVTELMKVFGVTTRTPVIGPNTKRFIDDVRYFAKTPERVRALAKFSRVGVSAVKHWLFVGDDNLLNKADKFRIIEWIAEQESSD